MCGQPRGAPVRRVRWPTNEYEYDGVWNEASARELSVFPTTTGAPPPEFHTYINQQDGVLVCAGRSHQAPCPRTRQVSHKKFGRLRLPAEKRLDGRTSSLVWSKTR